ncbi:hypothetical protein R6258_07895 [Halomonas sp. HP20-15]|uniref:phage tail assembly protein T n=1 Tax=Halomonas sp. HP20-15 TaxID=3085901 RepID=UPI0029822989|nr:hypothetical protein [Halomonas sp. HP20-15]MDW5376842.1 hypothetical protein [Halomonas sp. HP20-15]
MNGIGGRTIAEAQQRISFPEFKAWAAYRNKRGSLNTGMRIERGAAMLATLYANRHRKESDPARTIYEFMPHQDEPAISVEQAMESWT